MKVPREKFAGDVYRPWVLIFLDPNVGSNRARD
jgi:hypothetical protein